MKRFVWISALSALAMIMLAVGTPLARVPSTEAQSAERAGFAPTTQGAAAAQRAAAGRAPSPSANMTYHGGSIMQTVTAYAIYWTPNNQLDATYQNLINRFLTDVGGTGYYNTLTQYTQTGGAATQNVVTFGGSFVDSTTSYGGKGTVANPFLNADLRAEVQHAIAVNPGWTPPSLTTQYFLFTEQGIESCFDAAHTQCTQGITTATDTFCAYHTFNTNGPIIFSNMPYANTWNGNPGCVSSSAKNNPTNGNTPADAEINFIAHELFEATNDPRLDAWFDSDTSGEIADKCSFRFGTIAADGSNVTLNGHKYLVQQQWSNATFDGSTPFSGCALSFSTGPAPTPTATPTRTLTPTITRTPVPGSCILGDINCDAIVDIRDYGQWRLAFGQTNSGNPADLDINHIVDIRDYGIWRQNFGHVGPAGPGAAPAVAPPIGTPTPTPSRTPTGR
jgi:hypothetical protein